MSRSINGNSAGNSNLFKHHQFAGSLKLMLILPAQVSPMKFITYPLLPFSFLYGGITSTRNWLYDRALLSSYQFPVPVINVGNLSVGGTGKTPHIEYLVRILTGKKIAVLSRGYKRKTTGFILATASESAVTLGDEPYQYFKKFPEIAVAVCEDRVKGINQLLALMPKLQVILLDDAFQHRPVQAHLNILITDYNRLFFRDQLLPAGHLRESRAGAQRADVVVVSKSPAELSAEEALNLKSHIQLYIKPGVPVYFSHYRYETPVAFGTSAFCQKKILLLTGIAQPASLQKYLKDTGYEVVKHFNFPDHYAYRQQDIQEIYNFAKNTENCSILTTEKDWVKLAAPAFQEQIRQMPIFYIPIVIAFSREGEKFNQLIADTVSALPII